MTHRPAKWESGSSSDQTSDPSFNHAVPQRRAAGALEQLMQCVSRIRLVLSRPICLRWSLLCSPKACQALLPPTLTSAVQRKRVESSCATHDQAPLCPIVDPVAKMRDFYGCYLLTSLDPKNKGRTYIGSDTLTAAGSVNATQVCINSTMLCRFSPTFFVSL